MTIVKIFKCIGNEGETIPQEILGELNISYKDANNDVDSIAILSKRLKEHNKGIYCVVPFCHTLEAESLGSTVIFDYVVGNRIGKYSIEDIESIKTIPSIDLYNGRISKVLEAIKRLKDNGEKVQLDIMGPISLVTSIMDIGLFYKTLRKDKKTINKLLELIEDNIVAFILEGIKQGVDIISFADPTGTIDIVGPKVYEEISGKSTYNILKKIENQLGNTIVHLCGKTSTSLESIGLLEIEIVEVHGSSYSEMISNISKERDDIKFIGHWCMKLDKAVDGIIWCRIK